MRDIDMRYPDGCADCADGNICPNIVDEFSQKVEPTIRDYDLYILATPTWSDNVTPLALVFWDRIVSWCHEDKQYLKDKQLAVITHGMADERSWQNVVNWVKSVCLWEQCNFAGSLTCSSGGEVGELNLKEEQVDGFVKYF